METIVIPGKFVLCVICWFCVVVVEVFGLQNPAHLGKYYIGHIIK